MMMVPIVTQVATSFLLVHICLYYMNLLALLNLNKCHLIEEIFISRLLNVHVQINCTEGKGRSGRERNTIKLWHVHVGVKLFFSLYMVYNCRYVIYKIFKNVLASI